MNDFSPSPLKPNMNEHEKTTASALVPLESLLERPRKALDLAVLREKLAAGRGPAFWRTLEEAAETDHLREYVEQEFPGLSGPNSARSRSPEPAEGDGCVPGHGGCGGLY